MKRFLTTILIGLMLISSLSVSASANFSDVKQDDWYYETVTEMTEKGLFEGKGNNLFCPDDTMSRAEFITVVTRALYSDELANMPAVSGEFWYSNNYDVALNNGLITETEFAFSGTILNAPMPRQEMALILTRACEQMGEGTGVLLSDSRISDYNTVGDYYKIAVKTAYTKGLIAGKDATGRFDPHGTLTRAEGVTVLYRLVNESKRVDVTPNDTQTNTGETVNVNAPITIYEGQARYNRNAKAGDTFVKKDGTKIVLELDQYGVLGGGQGVAPDVGLLGQINETGCDLFTYKVADYGSWVDSTGSRLQNAKYSINATTGEGYWSKEWQKLSESIPAPDRDGSYEGEVSSDSYHLYKWDGSDWAYNRVIIK